MLLIFDVNYGALIVATLLATVLGMLWYGPLFGRQWIAYMARMGKPIGEKMDAGAKKAMAFGVVATLVMAYVLHMLVSLLSISTIGSAIELAVLVWLGFMATILANSILYEQKDKKIVAIGAGYYLVASVIMTVTLALMI